MHSEVSDYDLMYAIAIRFLQDCFRDGCKTFSESYLLLQLRRRVTSPRIGQQQVVLEVLERRGYIGQKRKGGIGYEFTPGKPHPAWYPEQIRRELEAYGEWVIVNKDYSDCHNILADVMDAVVDKSLLSERMPYDSLSALDQSPNLKDRFVVGSTGEDDAGTIVPSEYYQDDYLEDSRTEIGHCLREKAYTDQNARKYVARLAKKAVPDIWVQDVSENAIRVFFRSQTFFAAAKKRLQDRRSGSK